MNAKCKTRVIVGMSGGVDSSVAALLLKLQGFDVHGVFMRNWEADQDDPHCTASQDLTDARTVCDRLNIPLQTVNFAKEYWDHVFQHFLNEYAAGRTPNPDILCNKEIKFKAFLDYALMQGADYIATGHYARIQMKDNHYCLLKGLDANKDQSYFLYTLGEHQLKHALFPVGELAKNEVRQIAKDAGFINHSKKDSTGICFIGERKFKPFLNEYLLAKPGTIETTQGCAIGKHSGLMFYTIGQRKGLGIGGTKNASEAAWYVINKDIARNVLIVGQSHDHPMLFKQSLICDQLHWVNQREDSFLCSAKTRYRQIEQPCSVNKINENQYQVQFNQPQWGITAGQSVVFYENNICLGGGVIDA